MTQKICRCVRRLTVEDTCLHDVLGTIESLCESQVLWSKCPTTSSSFFINPWLNPIVIILRSHFRSLLRFFTRPYSPKYFLHNCAGTCGHVPAIIYSRMVSGKDAYIVHYFSIFQQWIRQSPQPALMVSNQAHTGRPRFPRLSCVQLHYPHTRIV